MKFYRSLDFIVQLSVALYMRAWIEILLFVLPRRARTVALYMRAWIEIKYNTHRLVNKFVALYMRAWIEIVNMNLHKK